MGKQSLDDDKLKMEAIKLKSGGKLSDQAISDILGVPRSTLNRFLLRKSHAKWWSRHTHLKCPPRGASPLESDDIKEKAYFLFYDQRKTFSEISRELGVPRTSLREFLTGQIYHEWWSVKDPSKITNDLHRRKPAASTATLADDDTKRMVAKMANTPNMTIVNICEVTGLPRRVVEEFLAHRTYPEFWEEELIEDVKVFSGTIDEPTYEENLMDSYNVFVVTSAQNNTHVNGDFLSAIEGYCKHNSAKLLISPYVYNLDGILGSKQDAIAYDERIEQYLVSEPTMLSTYLGGLIFCAELDILPTAASPLSGLHTYTKQASGIFPHAKMHMESLPTQKSDPCRMLYTTGTVTLRNYIQRKAGQKASFHHIFGALVVEVDHANKCWYVRQLNADHDGTVHDLGKKYFPSGKVESAPIESINWGDIHAEKLEQEQLDLNFGKNGILNSLTPKYQFAHDLSDFTPRNHHNRNDPHFLYATSLSKIRTVEDGLNQAAKVLSIMARDWCDTIVVNSNHDNAFEKWLREADYRSDPENAVLFLRSQLRCYEAIQRGDRNYSVFEDALVNIISSPIDPHTNRVKFLRMDETFKVCAHLGAGAIECGAHGDRGSNGSRGSISGFQKLGTKVNIGHSHSAFIRDGVYQAGVTGNLDMGYNIGPSSWSHSHIITYTNGKRTIITTHGSSWRLLDSQKVVKKNTAKKVGKKLKV